MSRKKLTPYQKIKRAAQSGRGVRLSYDECFDIYNDTTIRHRADMDDSGVEQPTDQEIKDFGKSGESGEKE